MIHYIRKTDEKQRWLFFSTLLNAALAASKLAWGWTMGSTLVVASVAELNAVKAHKSINEVVEKLHKNIDALEAVTIHYEPQHLPYETVGRLLQGDKQTPSQNFGRSVWLEVTHLTKDKKQISQEFIKNPALEATHGKAFRLVAFLLSLHTDKIIMGNVNMDENIVTLFDALNIEIIQQNKEKQQ